MFISIYISKTLIYILIYCVFKLLFYISAKNFFSSFIPILYFLSITKIFSFILNLFKVKITKKIQSIENNDNINQNHRPLIQNAQQVQQQNNNNNNVNRIRNRRRFNLNNFRRKLISLFFILCASILEVIFYASFNKMNEKDDIGFKRAFYYLTNNKLCFLIELAFIYLVFYKKYNNVHNILSLFIIFFSQIIIYILNYEENDKNYSLLLYIFFLNILYASQNVIEKEINGEHINNIPTMVIMGYEGIMELILVFILNIGVDWYYGQSPYDINFVDTSIVVKTIFMMLCILLSEYVRIDLLNKFDPFYICFSEEIIYIFFTSYYFPSKQLNYLFFQILIIISFLIFIETIELNFCGLNHSTQRYIREREYGNLNDIMEGIANISSLSTGSNSGSGSNEHNNRDNDLFIDEDIFNFDLNNQGDVDNIDIISGKNDDNEESNDDNIFKSDGNNQNNNNININTNKSKNNANINIGKLLDDEDESCDDEHKNVFSNHLID